MAFISCSYKAKYEESSIKLSFFGIFGIIILFGFFFRVGGFVCKEREVKCVFDYFRKMQLGIKSV